MNLSRFRRLKLQRSGDPYGDIVNFNLAADARAFSVARAKQLGVFLSAPSAFEDEFSAPPATSPSKWLRALSSLGTTTQLADARGGVVRITTGNGANNTESFSLGPATGDLPGLVSDPGVPGTRFYLLWIFSTPTAVDNQTSAVLNITPTSGNANKIFAGIDGVFDSTTFLMVEENLVNVTLSSMQIGPPGTWHYLELYQVGVANQILFGFDGEPLKTLTLTAPFGHAGTLQIAVNNGTTLNSPKSLDHDHVVLLMDNNVALRH